MDAGCGNQDVGCRVWGVGYRVQGIWCGKEGASSSRDLMSHKSTSLQVTTPKAKKEEDHTLLGLPFAFALESVLNYA
jgi:hypothetical protein